MDPQLLIPATTADPALVEDIVNYLKARGIFDQFRQECLADVDTKSSCQNLSQRIDGYTLKFLDNETWNADSNKNEVRNKLRRNIDESEMLKAGADHVVEQVINPKIYPFFTPKIREIVHQYTQEKNELLNKKPDTYLVSSETAFTYDKISNETADSKTKTLISDPIADILSFSYSKSKPTTSSNIQVKTENVQQKPVDLLKLEKKKEEKALHTQEKSTPETISETASASVTMEMKFQIDKEKDKIKKEEFEVSLDVSKKVVKEEAKPEKKKVDDSKVLNSELSSSDENKSNSSTPSKTSLLGKKDHEKNKQKLKSTNPQKSSNSSNETKKIKKELSDKSSEKHNKIKAPKSPKESSSPSKNVSGVKIATKEEKIGESSRAKSADCSNSKASDASFKKKFKTNVNKINNNSKQRSLLEKSDKSKIIKPAEKNDQSHQDSSSSEKGTKNIHYSSSYDSSQGSDQDKSSSSSSKKERQKHFSKSTKKEKSEDTDKNDSKKMNDVDEGITKKSKNEKSSKLEKLKNVAEEAAKISSRSNSFGSTSSIGSSSNTSKDNLVSNSDELSESSVKDKKKKQTKEKGSCHNPDVTLPPPPPPPPPSSSLTPDATSSAEMSSMDDTTQSSCDSETSSSRERSEEPLSDSELELNDIDKSTLNENILNILTDSGDSILEKLFLSSSSSEFEGFDNSPEKMKEESEFQNLLDSDVSVSSVHTSDLSSYNDALSDDDFSLNKLGFKKQLTLKEAEELIKNKVLLQKRNKKSSSKDNSNSNTSCLQDENCTLSSSSFLSSLENSPVKEDVSDSDVSVSSVHTSDLSSFDDELSDDGLFFNESPSGSKKRLTLKEAEDLIRNKAGLLEKVKNSPSENESNYTPTVSESSSQKSLSKLSSDEEASPVEPKRSLRRERKLNPRYASSEYTSIFNCKKETFITKQSSPVKNNPSPNSEQKSGKRESLSEKCKSSNKNSVEALQDAVHQEKTEISEEAKVISHNSKLCNDDKDSSNSSDRFDLNNLKTITGKEKMLKINNKHTDNSESDHLKVRVKLKFQNNSKLNMNSHSLKRKLSLTESTPSKGICIRSSVNSISSELVPNENKPFNSDKQNSVDEKILRENELKGSDITGGIKKDLFCKQKSTNNGDILGKKDNFSMNSHGRTANNTEKKTAEPDTSKELNAL